MTRITRFVLLYYTDIAHTIRTNFHDRIVDRIFLFISLVSFKIINSRSHNISLYYYNAGKCFYFGYILRIIYIMQ